MSKKLTGVTGFVLFKTELRLETKNVQDGWEIELKYPHLADYWHANEAVRDLWEAKAVMRNVAVGVIPFTLHQTTGFQAFIAPDEQSAPPLRNEWALWRRRRLGLPINDIVDTRHWRARLNARKALWKAMTKQEQNEWYEEHKQPTIQAMAAPALFLISQESAGAISGLPRGVLEIIAIHMVRWEDVVKAAYEAMKVRAKELQTEKLVDA